MEITNYVSQEGYNISKGVTYLSVSHYLTSIGILLMITVGLLSIIFAMLNKQIKKSSDSNGLIYNKIEANRLEAKADLQRSEDKNGSKG